MKTDTAPKSDFEGLLGEITDLAKSFPAKDNTKKDDVKIEGAAKDGEDESDADKDDGKDVSKSFNLTLEDGTVIEAMDGAALFKALSARVEANETTSLSAIRGLTDMVKSLIEHVTTLSAAPKGRKTVLAISEKAPAAGSQDLNKSDADKGVSSDEFFAKALSMQAEGKISGVEVRRAEAYLNAGKSIPAEIIRKVLG